MEQIYKGQGEVVRDDPCFMLAYATVCEFEMTEHFGGALLFPAGVPEVEYQRHWLALQAKNAAQASAATPSGSGSAPTASGPQTVTSGETHVTRTSRRKA